MFYNSWSFVIKQALMTTRVCSSCPSRPPPWFLGVFSPGDVCPIKRGAACADHCGVGGCAGGCRSWDPVVGLGKGFLTGWSQFLVFLMFPSTAPTEPFPVGFHSLSSDMGCWGSDTGGKTAPLSSVVGEGSSTGMDLPLVSHLDGMMTQRGQCHEPGVGFCGQRGVWFSHLPGLWCVQSLEFSSLPFPAGPPAFLSFPEAPTIVAVSGVGDYRSDDARIEPFTGESRYKSWGASPCGSAPVVPALPGATSACGDRPLGTRKLHQGLCNPEGWGCPGQLP